MVRSAGPTALLVSVLALVFVIALGVRGDARAQVSPHKPSAVLTQASGGPHDFDFEFGKWRVHHRVKRDGRWLEFEGTCTDRGLVDGSANVEEHTFVRPSGTSYGIAVRAYDTKAGQWAIWWIDGRDPHAALDPPVKGRFADGTGTFYSDSVVDGKTIRTRYVWSRITPKSARWEQAMSSDLGKTWDTNWVMEFSRIE
ncbi:MAG TPA: hypothetical protein VLM79_38825 [Kofleriaceae bacterium]|nr:hypothetical protein [Kofleriaceae bacterium]